MSKTFRRNKKFNQNEIKNLKLSHHPTDRRRKRKKKQIKCGYKFIFYNATHQRRKSDIKIE